MANPHVRSTLLSCSTLSYPRRSLLPLPAMSSPSATKSDDLPDSSLEIVGVRRSLLSCLVSLQRPYRAFPVLGWNRHAETIFAAFYKSLPVIKLRRECLRTKDDGAVALDLVSGDDTELPFGSPVFIFLVVSLVPLSLILMWNIASVGQLDLDYVGIV
ncbi:embryogenesis-associated protein EMB8 [Carex littledalei]|uniref:Embryogenesis-associated protein EMB8 n=1 Tax=Carex littledalei TaxID=544730 RepID=A0A833VDV2_9POAL|nr:embryogenesis-associated protein EMB8 [Carex littledalei]